MGVHCVCHLLSLAAVAISHGIQLLRGMYTAEQIDLVSCCSIQQVSNSRAVNTRNPVVAIACISKLAKRTACFTGDENPP